MTATPEAMYDPAEVDLSERGTRRPRHQAVVTTPAGHLQPFMAAPIRPNETITNLAVSGWSQYSQMIKTTASPPIITDLLFALVPVSAFGPEMIDAVLQDLSDDTIGANANQPGTTGTSNTTFNENSHFDGRIRWAGHAWADTNSEVPVPWVAKATQIIASMLYDHESDSSPDYVNDFNDQDRWGPPIGHFMRTTTRESIDFNQANLGAVGNNMGDIAERLSALGKPDQTYIDYLAGYGVNPRNVGGLPEIIGWERELLMPTGSPQMFGAISSGATGLSGIFGAITRLFGGGDYVGDEGGMAGARHVWHNRYGNNIIADEPSILIGLTSWHPFLTDTEDFVHYLDMNLMNKPGHWGNPVGGLSEIDFLSTGNLAAAENTPGDSAGGLTYNMLNLYLNGDVFCNDSAAFDFLGVGNDPIGEDNRRVNSMLDVKLSVATDMVQ